jgi:putative mRNA 3-end processing factor
MRVRGNRRRGNYDRGFVLSDHADWPALLATIAECGARRVLVTHGYADVLARAVAGRGIEASALATPYADQDDAGA